MTLVSVAPITPVTVSQLNSFVANTSTSSGDMRRATDVTVTTVTTASPAPSGLSVGAIAGIAVSGVVFLGVVVCVIFLGRRKGWWCGEGDKPLQDVTRDAHVERVVSMSM